MRVLHVTLAPRVHSYLRLELVVTEDTTLADICEFAMTYAPASFSTGQRIAQSIVRAFAKVPEGKTESLGIA